MIKSFKRKEIKYKHEIQFVDSKDNATVVKYQEYIINADKPDEMEISEWYGNDEAKSIYKSNRTEIRKLEAEFEDEIYEIQDQIIKDFNKEQN